MVDCQTNNLVHFCAAGGPDCWLPLMFIYTLKREKIIPFFLFYHGKKIDLDDYRQAEDGAL
jgi:hypothetical protein